jgi:hypothetical protein
MIYGRNNNWSVEEFMKLLGVLTACILAFSNISLAADQVSVTLTDVNSFQHLVYNFGRVYVNTMNRVVYNLTNTGNQPLVRSQFSIEGSYFDAYTTCPTIMNPGVRCGIEIRYWPPFIGNHFGRMQMVFTNNTDLIIDLYGEAYQ